MSEILSQSPYEEAKEKFLEVKRMFIENNLMNTPAWRKLWAIRWRCFPEKTPEEIFSELTGDVKND